MKTVNACPKWVAPLLLFAASVALAADPPADTKDAMRELSRICRPDVERLCADVDKGGGRKMTCLRSHSADLSPACRDGLEKAAAARKGGAST